MHASSLTDRLIQGHADDKDAIIDDNATVVGIGDFSLLLLMTLRWLNHFNQVSLAIIIFTSVYSIQ